MYFLLVVLLVRSCLTENAFLGVFPLTLVAEVNRPNVHKSKINLE
jgi:hypothetical protein